MRWSVKSHHKLINHDAYVGKKDKEKGTAVQTVEKGTANSGFLTPADECMGGEKSMLLLISILVCKMNMNLSYVSDVWMSYEFCEDLTVERFCTVGHG